MSVWSTDPSEPPPGVTIQRALLRHGANEAVVQERSRHRAVATIEEDGRVIESLVLTTWSKGNGSWYVESGARCGGR
jgi:hypothetical protein